MGVACDCCLKSDFKESRFKCLICTNYDLCLECHHRREESATHKTSHSMQCIPTINELKIFFGGQSQIPLVAQSFVCPFCPKMGFTPCQLADHVNAKHLDKISDRVFCPICVTLFSEVESMVFDLGHHISIHHQQSAFESHEDLSTRKMRRLQHTVREIAGVGTLRTRMNTHFMNISENKDSNDPLSEILSQLSVSRSRNLGSSASGISHHFQINLFPTGFCQFDSPRESLYVPPFSPLSTAFDSSSAVSSGKMVMKARNISTSSSSSEEAKDKTATLQANLNPEIENKHLFILDSFQNIHDPELLSLEIRNIRPLFVQELVLLSVIQPDCLFVEI